MKKSRNPEKTVKPFLKWAGGKGQLLEAFRRRLPRELETGEIRKYVEPFIGGGAVFFDLAARFGFSACHLWDINEELVLTYKVVKRAPERLVADLFALEEHYLDLTEPDRERFYYAVRDQFNDERESIRFFRYSPAWVPRAARMIFLNHTCYNGLFRVNRKGGFNVPFGRYARPKILDPENIRLASEILAGTGIHHGDFTACLKTAGKDTFVYLDPPYRPLNRTSSFTSYAMQGFTDTDQERLADLFRNLDRKGAKVMLSNSDPRNGSGGDSFLEDLYRGYHIDRVPAKRMINSVGRKRGPVSELIVTNY
jgi:DNA adenine methylase